MAFPTNKFTRTYEGQNSLLLNNGEWSIDNVPATATAAQLNAAGGHPPFNGIQVYLSQLIGNDATANGTQSFPFQTGPAVEAFINSLTNDCTLIVMDDALYDTQFNFTSGYQVNIFGQSAEIEFSGTGDTLTFNSNTLSFVQLGALTASNGNGLVNNAGTVIAYIGGIAGSINAALANNSGIWLEATAALAGNLNTSAGGNIFAQIGQFFGTAGPGVFVQTISSTNTDWNIAGQLTASGKLYDTTSGSPGAGYVMTFDGISTINLQPPASSNIYAPSTPVAFSGASIPIIAAFLQDRIIVNNNAGPCSWTLDTAANLNAGFPGIVDNDSFGVFVSNPLGATITFHSSAGTSVTGAPTNALSFTFWMRYIAGTWELYY